MLRKILIFIPMLFGVLMGSLAFLSPELIGGVLGVSADNAAGRGAIVGDFGSFFFVGAGAAALALFQGKNHLLWIPIALFSVTVVGRVFDIVASGFGPGAGQPILIELVLIAMLFTALKISKKEA